MSYIIIPGDIVDFTDSTTGKKYRGYIDEYRKGRDEWNSLFYPYMQRPFSELRDYLVVFDEELWAGFKQAWCAPQDLTIVRKANTTMKSNVKIVDNTSATTNTVYYSGSTVSSSCEPNKGWTDLVREAKAKAKAEAEAQIEALKELNRKIAEENDRFRPYYLTSRQFFDVLETAFNDTYGSNTEWHPEDLFANVEAVLEVTTNALANAMRVKNGQSTRGVKEI